MTSTSLAGWGAAARDGGGRSNALTGAFDRTALIGLGGPYLRGSGPHRRAAGGGLAVRLHLPRGHRGWGPGPDRGRSAHRGRDRGPLLGRYGVRVLRGPHLRHDPGDVPGRTNRRAPGRL